MFRVLSVIVFGFICYMGCTKLPMPVEDENVTLMSTKADTTEVDSSNVVISITVDTTLNVKEHFITL